MHLYFLLKALIMIATVAIYVFYSYYLDMYQTIALNYGLSSSLLLIQTTLEVIFFILLLIGLDRRVSNAEDDLQDAYSTFASSRSNT
jgi:hypothetical protein